MPQLSFTPAPLSDPLYYLANARLLIEWSREHHSDLLLQDEILLLKQFQNLSTDAQALLIRMIMRKGELFRSDNLSYDEIADIPAAVISLEQQGLIDCQPEITLEELCHLLRKPECLAVARSLLPDQKLAGSLSKAILTQLLMEQLDSPQKSALTEWWANAPFSLLKLTVMPLFDRIRLMFFGNLYQDWSEFVLTELGLQQYEQVQLNKGSRAFSSRTEVDQYLLLHHIQSALELGSEPETLVSLLPDKPESVWLSNRYHRLLFQLGHSAERNGQIDTALSLYTLSNLPEAKIRQLRVQEKNTDPLQVYHQAIEYLRQFPQPEIQLSFKRICRRSARKAAIDYPDQKPGPLPTLKVILKQPDNLSVEQAVISDLARQNIAAYHVENQLFNSLFALLFWPAIFAPVKGAFFNPFQSGPVDLFRAEFADLRHQLIERQMATLKDGSYREIILQRYQDKQGTSCALIHWPSLSEALLRQSLELIPGQHLQAIFQRFLLDLKNHKRGLPDLICFDTANHRYKLIEVKGPGDRLQDHQRLWIEFLIGQGIDTEICYVEWT